jgi:hypothetical protein
MLVTKMSGESFLVFLDRPDANSHVKSRIHKGPSDQGGGHSHIGSVSQESRKRL